MDEVTMKQGSMDNVFEVFRGGRFIGAFGLEPSTNRWWGVSADLNRHYSSSFEAIAALVDSDKRFMESV